MGYVPGFEVLRLRIGTGDEEWGVGCDPKHIEGQHDADQHADEDQHRPPGTNRSGGARLAVAIHGEAYDAEATSPSLH